MDSDRFDRLSRGLANGVSRRGVLKGVFGGAAAVATGGLARRSATAQEVCVAAGETCNALHPCCAGTECTGGVCVAHPVCGASGGACNALHPCCAGTECTGGVCAPPPVPLFCGHSVGANGGCKGACTAAGFTGNQCNPICGNGQFVGACPVGQGGDNPCCNTGYCNPANFVSNGSGGVTYVGRGC